MGDNEEKKPSGKTFIEETIKSKPVNKKRFFIHLILTLIIAAAAACVAAFVFVNMIPVAEKVSGREPEKGKISITDEESSDDTGQMPAPTEAASVNPSEGASDDSSDGTSKDTSDSESEGTGDNSSGAAGGEADDASEDPENSADGEGAADKDGSKDKEGSENKEDTEVTEDQVRGIVTEELTKKELSLDDYITLYGKMSEITEKAQTTIVSVTGITSMMDYFENTYENSQQLSGVIVADSGEELYILTGYSVLENVERIQVTFADGYISDAYFVRHDPDTGLAVIKVNAGGIPEETKEAVSVASFSTVNNAKPGDRVIAVGTLLGYNHSITYGTVISISGVYSASDCSYDIISTDIGAGGSSSGVLLNLRGAITGIIIPADKRSSDNSLTAFAAPDVKGLIETLSNNEARPYIGIHGMDVTDSIAERSGIAKGILITSIETDSPAMLAGIMDHDILVKVGDASVMTIKEYESALSGYEPGDDIHIIAMRMGNEGYTEMEFDVTVGDI